MPLFTDGLCLYIAGRVAIHRYAKPYTERHTVAMVRTGPERSRLHRTRIHRTAEAWRRQRALEKCRSRRHVAHETCEKNMRGVRPPPWRYQDELKLHEQLQVMIDAIRGHINGEGNCAWRVSHKGL
eukprot:4702368-Amphidinium_carterae.1